MSDNLLPGFGIRQDALSQRLTNLNSEVLSNAETNTSSLSRSEYFRTAIFTHFMFLSRKHLTWRPIRVSHRVFELLDVSEPEPDDAGHDDNDQREDFGTCEQVLDEGG